MPKRKEFRERVGRRIKARRVAAGLTQPQLARKLPGEMDGSQISRWERGESFPAYANLLALARALEVSEELLICGCGDEHETDRPARVRAVKG